jgi:hypothetical protein
VWRLRKLHHCVDAELRPGNGPCRFEIQFFFNGEFAYSRHCRTRDLALAEAAEKRAELERDGWMFHW